MYKGRRGEEWLVGDLKRIPKRYRDLVLWPVGVAWIAFHPKEARILKQHIISCHIFSVQYPIRYHPIRYHPIRYHPIRYHKGFRCGPFEVEQPKRYQNLVFNPYKVWWPTPYFYRGVSPRDYVSQRISFSSDYKIRSPVRGSLSHWTAHSTKELTRLLRYFQVKPRIRSRFLLLWFRIPNLLTLLIWVYCWESRMPLVSAKTQGASAIRNKEIAEKCLLH